MISPKSGNKALGFGTKIGSIFFSSLNLAKTGQTAFILLGGNGLRSW